MGFFTEQQESERQGKMSYDVSSLQQILVDTVILPALSSLQLNLGEFPSNRFKRTLMSDCRSVVNSLDLEKRFDLSLKDLMAQIDLEACYHKGLCDCIRGLLRQHFSHGVSDDPSLFLDVTDGNQARLDLVLKGAKWLYKACGEQPNISSTQAFHEVNRLFNEAQQAQMDRNISH